MMFTKIGWRGSCLIWETFLNQTEYSTLLVRVGTSKYFTELYFFLIAYPKPAFEKFIEPYCLSSKEPDLCLIPGYQKPFWPTVLIETGWTESSWSYLKDDARVWLLGARPNVQMVISICWSHIERQIKGTLRVYERGVNNSLLERQVEVRSTTWLLSRKNAYIEWLTWQLEPGHIPSTCECNSSDHIYHTGSTAQKFYFTRKRWSWYLALVLEQAESSSHPMHPTHGVHAFFYFIIWCQYLSCICWQRRSIYWLRPTTMTKVKAAANTNG